MKLRCSCGAIIRLKRHAPAWKGWYGQCERCRMVYHNMQTEHLERVT